MKKRHITIYHLVLDKYPEKEEGSCEMDASFDYLMMYLMTKSVQSNQNSP